MKVVKKTVMKKSSPVRQKLEGKAEKPQGPGKTKEQLREEKIIADKKSLEALNSKNNSKSKSKPENTRGPMQLKSPAKTSPTKMKKC